MVECRCVGFETRLGPTNAHANYQRCLPLATIHAGEVAFPA